MTSHAVRGEDIRATLDALGLVGGGSERLPLVRHDLWRATFWQIDLVAAPAGIDQRVRLALDLDHSQCALVKGTGQRVVNEDHVTGHVYLEFKERRAPRWNQGRLHVRVDQPKSTLDIDLVENFADGVK